MPFCEWKDKNWESLICAIKQNTCILMLGPDAPCEMVEGQQRPLTEILANKLAAMIDQKARETINTSDLAQVAQCFTLIERDRNKLITEVSNFYNQRKELQSDLYRNLAALPFYLTINTTPDFMFQKALEEAGKFPKTDMYHFKKADKVKSMVETIGTVDNPLVFHLYGKIDESRSLVITENDILDFLVCLIRKDPPMPENILGELRDESKNFLFIGFGFRNWYLRILLHVLNGRNKESSSFAFEQFIPPYEDQFRQTVFFFQKSSHNIHIFKKDFNDFVAQLREKCENEMNFQKPLMPSKPPHDIQQRPLVFICHAHEDKEFAAYLYHEFKKVDFYPWLDKKNLATGEEWDPEIETIISKCNYFVVIHSKKLAARYTGYVIKEINLALKRKQHFWNTTPFIIPVKIDDTPLIKEFEKIQAFDLTEKMNIDNLIKTIKRDLILRESYEKQR